jgi:hypothetical protein
MLSLSSFLGIGVGSSAKTTGFGANSVFRSGAPRPMKMGTIASPWRYDKLSSSARGDADPAARYRITYAERT